MVAKNSAVADTMCDASITRFLYASRVVFDRGKPGSRGLSESLVSNFPLLI